MFINEIKVMQRRNLGNYEHREVTMGMALVETDSPEEALKILNGKIKIALGYEKSVEVGTAVKEKEVEEKPEPPKKKAASPKKKAAPKKKEVEPVVIPTMEDMVTLCRETATKLGSAEKVKSLITEVCGVGSLKECTDDKCFLELSKKLKDAK